MKRDCEPAGNAWRAKASAILSPGHGQNAIGMLLLLLGAGFTGLTMYTMSKELGGTIPWQAAVLAGSAAAFVAAYLLRSVFPLPFAILGLGAWWVTQETAWASGHGIRYIVLAAGLVAIALACFALGRIERHRSEDSANVYFAFAAVPIAAGVLFVAALSCAFLGSSKAGLLLVRYVTGEGATALDSPPMAATLAVMAAAAVVLALYGAVRHLMRYREAALVAVGATLAFVLAALPGKVYVAGPAFSQAITGTGVAYVILFNILVFAGLACLLLAGYYRGKTWLVNVGVLLLIAFVVVKYFDWFFRLSSRSVFFIGAGLLLLVVGLLMEAGRRLMLSSMKGAGESNGELERA